MDMIVAQSANTRSASLGVSHTVAMAVDGRVGLKKKVATKTKKVKHSNISLDLILKWNEQNQYFTSLNLCTWYTP